MLFLSIAEHIEIDLSYHREVNQNLQERARKSLVGPSFYTEFLSGLSFPLLERAKREHLLTAAPKAPADPKDPPPVKGKNRGGKKGVTQNQAQYPHEASRNRSRSRSHRRSPTPRRNRTQNAHPQNQAHNQAHNFQANPNHQPVYYRRQQQPQTQKGAGRGQQRRN